MTSDIKPGDLVNFFSTFAAFQKEYKERNPGIVIAVSRRNVGSLGKSSAEVMWKNNTVTSEFLTYLSVID